MILSMNETVKIEHCTDVTLN